jgi:hypothetical protein
MIHFDENEYPLKAGHLLELKYVFGMIAGTPAWLIVVGV